MELSCHLILANGCGINYISYSKLLDQFIKRLITTCNYSAGYRTELPMTICLDVQTELKEYCLAHREYTAFGKLIAISFSKNYTKINFLIDARIFAFSHRTLDNIALSMIGTISYAMLVYSGNYSPAHCALLEIHGKGALICAPSETGKSTCARRLPVPHKALADDCALIIRSGNDFIAQAMPTWSMLANHLENDHLCFDCSASIKVSGIFFLEQSFTDEIHYLHNTVAHGHLNSSFNDQMRWLLTHFPDDMARQMRMKMFSLAGQITARLPAYRLCATLNGEFWEVIYGALDNLIIAK